MRLGRAARNRLVLVAGAMSASCVREQEGRESGGVRCISRALLGIFALPVFIWLKVVAGEVIASEVSGVLALLVMAGVILVLTLAGVKMIFLMAAMMVVLLGGAALRQCLFFCYDGRGDVFHRKVAAEMAFAGRPIDARIIDFFVYRFFHRGEDHG